MHKFHDDRFKAFGYWMNNLRGCSVGIMDWKIYEVRLWDDLKWHDTHTTFYDDRFRNSTNIKFTASVILEVAVLVLLMGGLYEVRHWEDFMLHAY
jgi:hypothetical protein